MGKLICNNKKYRTRDGDTVVIDRKRASKKTYSVTGKVFRKIGGPVDSVWTEDGSYYYGKSSRLDLVEVIKDEDR